MTGRILFFRRSRPVPSFVGFVMPHRLEQFAACLLGGALGDALGAPVEFLDLGSIRDRYGAEGIQELDEAYGRIGAITDDTQMTLFTAEGLIVAAELAKRGQDVHVPTVVNRAYLRWLQTQEGRSSDQANIDEGWLLDVPALHSRRAPGNTCLSALHAGGMGTIHEPINSSKGCGTIMRIAPVGLVCRDPFQMGCEIAALTHGHPSGYLAAGFFTQVIHDLLEDKPLPVAIDDALVKLAAWADCDETVEAVTQALALAKTEDDTAETVELLGGGWVAEEALGIALFCALKAKSFEHGVRLAVNHTGDSDSTGAITGNLLGVIYGINGIPDHWLEQIELREEIERLARGLYEAGEVQ